LATCLGLVDPLTNQRWLFEATPDLRQQYFLLDGASRLPAATPAASLNHQQSQNQHQQIDGIFLTHAHIGHYSGLMFLGHESMGARGIVVHAMPRFVQFLQNNGPWSQLVRFGNIELRQIDASMPVVLNEHLQVRALPVPHRQEYSEVVGYRIDGPQRSVLFVPDIDSWHELDSLGVAIEDWIASVDIAYLDGTFYADGEIPGRDMRGFPHPFITHSMQRFSTLPANEKAKVHFIHFNHTNAAARAGSTAEQAIEAAGFHVAREGDRVGL
jgi:pyrroloquinoline quinone biosynthesis protein B